MLVGTLSGVLVGGGVGDGGVGAHSRGWMGERSVPVTCVEVMDD